MSFAENLPRERNSFPNVLKSSENAQKYTSFLIFEKGSYQWKVRMKLANHCHTLGSHTDIVRNYINNLRWQSRSWYFSKWIDKKLLKMRLENGNFPYFVKFVTIIWRSINKSDFGSIMYFCLGVSAVSSRYLVLPANMILTSSFTDFCRIFILPVGGSRGLGGQKVGEHMTSEV